MKYIIPILILIIIACSCKSDSSERTTPEDKILNQDTFVESNDPVVQNTMKLLQGTWHSRTDKNTSITFEKNTRIESKNGKAIGKMRYFEIADQCNNDTSNSNKIVKAKAKYISMLDIDMCYYIKKITRNELELSYVGRESTLKYIKNQSLNKGISKKDKPDLQRKPSNK